MKRINNSQPMAVSMQFRPMSSSMHIEVLGGLSASQFFRPVENRWIPDHSLSPEFAPSGAQVDGALRLKAMYSTIDPDGVIKADSLSPQVYWYVDGVQIAETDMAADFYVSENILFVRKNFTHLAGAMVSCECHFTDIRTNSPFVLSDSMVLSAVLQADEQWNVKIIEDKTRKHFPVSAASTIYSFSAEASLGSVQKNDAVSWFWDYSVDKGRSWHDIDDSCYWYVSGKNSDTLKVDMDFIEEVTVRVRCADDKSAVSPNISSFATASCAWRMPSIRPVVFCYGGDKVFAETSFMTFGCHVHVASHSDLTMEEQRHWLMFDWTRRTQSEVHSVWLENFSPSCVITGSDLFNFDGRKYIIEPGISLRGVYDTVATSDGELIQVDDDIIAIRS